MSDTANIKLCVLWEDELKAASKCLKAYVDGDNSDAENCNELAMQALEACVVALWGITDDSAVVITGSGSLHEHLRKRREMREKPQEAGK